MSPTSARATSGAETDRAGERPPRQARAALLTTSPLCPQAASHCAHDDVATPAPVDVEERANNWLVSRLSGTSAFMTTLDASIARGLGLPLSGSIEWFLIGISSSSRRSCSRSDSSPTC